MIKAVSKKDNELDFLGKVMELNNKMNSLDEIMRQKFIELSKVKTELLYQTEENKLLIDLYHRESEISIMKPKFTLLNCKYNIDTKKSACVLFRVKNIVYMTLVFKGDILEKIKELGKASIAIEMPMWKIYSGMFNVETLNNCLNNEDKLKHLCAKYEQNGNKIIIYINQNKFDEQTYWKVNKNSEFTIKANFFIEPPLRRRLGKFYIYNVLSNQVIRENNNELILDDDWTKGSLLEIYEDKKEMKIRFNNKYINSANNNNVFLDKNKKSDNDIDFVPGFADIIQIILYIDKTPFYLTIEENKLVLNNDSSGNNQFLIIPYLEK